MENGTIIDGQITASSQWDDNHSANQGRLNFQETEKKAGAWSAARNDGNQWLQINLGSPYITRVTSVATQGRNGYDQWVTTYRLMYSDDGVNFLYYKKHGVNKVIYH